MDHAESFTRELETELTQVEITERQEQLARSVKELEGIKSEQKKIQKFWSGKVNEAETNIRRLATACTTGRESRPILCHVRPDYRRFLNEIVRNDTGAVVDTKAMTGDELEEARQTGLFDGGATRRRVATEPKKLDLASPPAASGDDAANDAATAPTDDVAAGAADGTAITNPEGLLNGKEAEAATKRAKRRKKGEGMKLASAEDIARAHEEDAKPTPRAEVPQGLSPETEARVRELHGGRLGWPDCASLHGAAFCDMGEDCGKTPEQIDADLAAKQATSLAAAGAQTIGDPPDAADDLDVSEEDFEPEGDGDG